MNPDDITRYLLELDLIERDRTLGHLRAIRLLRSEFALAINASYLTRLSVDDIAVGAITRSIPQEGVARYTVVLDLVERTPQMTDEQAAELVRRELRRAQNAAQFRRIASEDLSVALVARERLVTSAGLRAA
jgi:EAL domain-containing protein (putative c-di-GMP-specific phosphodiesterase class I)